MTAAKLTREDCRADWEVVGWIRAVRAGCWVLCGWCPVWCPSLGCRSLQFCQLVSLSADAGHRSNASGRVYRRLFQSWRSYSGRAIRHQLVLAKTHQGKCTVWGLWDAMGGGSASVDEGQPIWRNGSESSNPMKHVRISADLPEP